MQTQRLAGGMVDDTPLTLRGYGECKLLNRIVRAVRLPLVPTSKGHHQDAPGCGD